MKQPAVVFPAKLRPIIGEAVRERIAREGAQVIALSVSGQQAHIQAKMPPAAVDHWIGLAKRHTTFVLRDHGWEGLVWAKRCKVKPVADRKHQENTFRYIRDHAEEGTWVWTFRDATVTRAAATP